MSVRELCLRAREASKHMALLSTEAKDAILHEIARSLRKNKNEIIAANTRDVERAQSEGKAEGFIDRLMLDEERIDAIAAAVMNVATLPDPVGDILDDRILENGLHLQRLRVPLGVIGMIYESRPNVTIDAAALCLKAGNAVILKGGSDAHESNKALVQLMRNVCAKLNVPEDTISHIETSDRAATAELLEQRGIVDVVIPRGGQGLIDFVVEHAKVPVIETGASVVHLYIHEDADIAKAVPIAINSKFRRVSICNALDTLLLHEKIAAEFLEQFTKKLPHDLQIRAAAGAAHKILQDLGPPSSIDLKKAAREDFDTEWLDYVLAIKTVRNEDEAIEQIMEHSLGHTESIVTESASVAETFLKKIDAACVYWNASTQFSDGAQFGLGAEIGISTQKLHVRGPFALEGLTSTKWIIRGNGQMRP